MADNRLERLLTQRDQLDAQIGLLSAREKQRARKRDTRRKILLGAVASKRLATNPNSAWSAQFMEELDRFILRPGDRQVLDLPPRPVPAVPDTGRKCKPSLKDGLHILRRDGQAVCCGHRAA